METLNEAPRTKKPRQRLPDDELKALHARTGTEQTVPTEEAAAIIDFAPQTLRRWACYNNGPIKPRRIGRQLRWVVSELNALLSPTA
jgi:hypothetical protein